MVVEESYQLEVVVVSFRLVVVFYQRVVVEVSCQLVVEVSFLQVVVVFYQRVEVESLIQLLVFLLALVDFESLGRLCLQIEPLELIS